MLFIDIVKNLEKYTINVGKTLYKYKKQLTILSFEPEPFLFSLLNKNIRLNNLVNCKSYNVALSSTKGRKKFYYYKPMQQIVSFPTDKQIYVKTNTLKDVLKIYPKNQEIFIKIDVEGHEKEVLQGVGNILKSFKKVTLLMEDSESVDSKKLLSYLSYNAHFLFKKTPYNSFWQIFPQSD